LFILGSYGLSETLATFLATLEVWLALRAARTSRVLDAALVGLVAGAAQLVRADACLTLPAVVLALWLVSGPRRRRVRLVAVCLGVATLVFSPWPVRNLLRFGRPYPAAWQWRTLGDGRPLPTGLLAWARTWATGMEREALLDFVFAAQYPLDLANPEMLRPDMYDDRTERVRVYGLLWRYNRHGLTPEIDARFRELASERAGRAPFRTYVLLPMRRMAALFRPVPEQELSMTSDLLGLPRFRSAVRFWDFTVYGLALLGLAVLLRRAARADHQRTALVLDVGILARSTVIPVLVPLAVTQRFLAQVYPLLIVLAAVGGRSVVGTVFSLLRGRRGRSFTARGQPKAPAPPERAPAGTPAG
jgi:hypothetical protein